MSAGDELWAHSPAPGTDIWHLLEDHLRGTAALAQRFAAPFGGGDLARWLGLLHDCGKAGRPWQERLAKVAEAGDKVGIDHKSLGARIAYERGLRSFSLAILGHHGGLVDSEVLGAELRKALKKAPENLESAEAELSRLLPDLPADVSGSVPQLWRREPLVGEMGLRLCYSALVDADVLDTQAHHYQLPAPRVRPDADFEHLFASFEQRRAEHLSRRPAAPVDRIREQVYADCLVAADRARGMFRLGAPTGAGKTLASAGFALRHAQRHHMRRVIVAVPFLTITEQNAAVYRAMLDEPNAEPIVLEHHSQVDFDDGAAGRWGRQAAENWDAPFVVTTFVRLFESLYARKPSAMRRVHRLAGSVIVLDEVQALRHDMLVPILDGLRALIDHFGSTVLLCSATQPDFWALSPFRDLDRCELVVDVAALSNTLRRVRYEWRNDPAPTLAEIADEAAEVIGRGSGPRPKPGNRADGAAMVVVNTTENARAVYERWREQDLTGVAWHLSTRMCPAHRRRVLRTVTERLRHSAPVLLAATQLIEAGVDVDFPVVFRAMAPADSLLQAAGRANREGLLEYGRVVIFNPVDGGRPMAYAPLVGAASARFGPGKADPDDADTLTSYYHAIYNILNLNGREHDGQLIQQARARWAFQTVAEGPLVDSKTGKRDAQKAFRLIQDDGLSVVTPQGGGTDAEQTEIIELIARIRTAPVPDLRDLRRLQPYTTTVHRGALSDPAVVAWMRPILGDQIRAGALVEWLGGYDSATGISFDPRVEEFVL